VVAFLGGFHGRTMGAVSLTASKAKYHAHFGPLLPGVYHVPFGNEGLEELERRVFKRLMPADEFAAVIVEPIQGEGGFVVPPADFLPGLKALCRRHGILLVADEVQTGCGRTGAFLASEHVGFDPDIVVLAKALGAGYPISAVVGRASIMDAPGPSAIGGTYVGNPVACAAANAVLQIIDEEGLIARADVVGKAIRARWEEVARNVPEIGEVRGVGAMVGVEMVTDPQSKAPNSPFLGDLVQRAMSNGVVAVTCGMYHNVLRHLVPLVISDEELQEGLDVLADAAVGARVG